MGEGLDILPTGSAHCDVVAPLVLYVEQPHIVPMSSVKTYYLETALSSLQFFARSQRLRGSFCRVTKSQGLGACMHAQRCSHLLGLCPLSACCSLPGGSIERIDLVKHGEPLTLSCVCLYGGSAVVNTLKGWKAACEICLDAAVGICITAVQLCLYKDFGL